MITMGQAVLCLVVYTVVEIAIIVLSYRIIKVVRLKRLNKELGARLAQMIKDKEYKSVSFDWKSRVLTRAHLENPSLDIKDRSGDKP